MAQPLKLSVNSPCHEDWGKMTPEAQGRFCLSCQKTVVDFSVMTDRQMLEYFSSYTGTTCGRFNKSQLNRTVTPEVQRPRNWFKYLLHLVMPALLISNKAKAQGEVQRDTSVSVADTTVLMGDTIMWPVDIIDTAKPVDPGEVCITSREFIDGLVDIETMVLGGFGIEPASQVDIFTSFKQFISDSLNISRLRLYPNPARPGAAINISHTLTRGNYTMQVLDLNGRVLQQEVINIAQDKLAMQLRLRNNLAAGQYMVLVTDGRRRKISERLIIQ